jgi:L-alanine-DL-glutamate epimerase-like enolase superfamily enzyme
VEELVEEALQAKERGFRGVKVKVGKPTVAEDAARVAAVRDALGPGLELMVDANQGLTLDQALRRARALEGLDLARLEEPLPADDVAGHTRLAVAPHFLMELHVSLAAAVPNARWVEHIPQLDEVALGGVAIHEGFALPPEEPGLGIEWNWRAIAERRVGGATLVVD